MLNRKAIAILGAIFLLIIGTLGFLIYQKRSASTATQTPASVATSTPDTSTPPATDQTPATDTTPTPDVLGGAAKLSDDLVVSPVLFFQGNGITYFTGTGQLFQTDLQNSAGKVSLSNKRELTIALKSGISKILWPSTGNNFIAQIQNGSKNTWSFYDSDKGAYVDLPSQVTSLSWMPGGQKIAYVWLDSKGKSTINIANGDLSGYQTLNDMWENDDQISVSPDGQNILYYETQNNGLKNPINLVTADGKVFRTIVADGFNQGVLWSPDSRKFVFGRRDPATQKFQLWLADITSGEVKNLGVSGSSDKALWSQDSQSLFAAVPAGSSASGGLSQDKLVKISVSTGASTGYDLKVAADARDMFLNSAGDTLFFKNYQDGGLYYISLSASSASSASGN